MNEHLERKDGEKNPFRNSETRVVRVKGWDCKKLQAVTKYEGVISKFVSPFQLAGTNMSSCLNVDRWNNLESTQVLQRLRDRVIQSRCWQRFKEPSRITTVNSYMKGEGSGVDHIFSQETFDLKLLNGARRMFIDRATWHFLLQETCADYTPVCWLICLQAQYVWSVNH